MHATEPHRCWWPPGVTLLVSRKDCLGRESTVIALHAPVANSHGIAAAACTRHITQRRQRIGYQFPHGSASVVPGSSSRPQHLNPSGIAGRMDVTAADGRWLSWHQCHCCCCCWRRRDWACGQCSLQPQGAAGCKGAARGKVADGCKCTAASARARSTCRGSQLHATKSQEQAAFTATSIKDTWKAAVASALTCIENRAW